MSNTNLFVIKHLSGTVMVRRPRRKRVCAKPLQSCLTLCDHMDCSPPGSSVHEILQARVLEWVAMPSKGSSQPRDQTWISCTASRFFTIGAIEEAQRKGEIGLKYVSLKHIFSYVADRRMNYFI